MATPTASQIVAQMMQHDAFSQWLGIEVVDVRPGYAQLRMAIRPAMLNGFGIAHGGITYSLADSALAFASNGHGRHAVSVETSISHLQPLRAGDTIVATATEEHLTHKIGYYRIVVTQAETPVAIFKGTVYRTSREWDASTQP